MNRKPKAQKQTTDVLSLKHSVDSPQENIRIPLRPSFPRNRVLLLIFLALACAVVLQQDALANIIANMRVDTGSSSNSHVARFSKGSLTPPKKESTRNNLRIQQASTAVSPITSLPAYSTSLPPSTVSVQRRRRGRRRRRKYEDVDIEDENKDGEEKDEDEDGEDEDEDGKKNGKKKKKSKKKHASLLPTVHPTKLTVNPSAALTVSPTSTPTNALSAMATLSPTKTNSIRFSEADPSEQASVGNSRVPTSKDENTMVTTSPAAAPMNQSQVRPATFDTALH
jgi:hypothetical protein